MDKRPPDQLGWNKDFTVSEPDHGAGHEGSAEHTYDTRKRMLQPRQRVQATRLLDRNVQEIKRWGQHDQRPPYPHEHTGCTVRHTH